MAKETFPSEEQKPYITHPEPTSSKGLVEKGEKEAATRTEAEDIKYEEELFGLKKTEEQKEARQGVKPEEIEGEPVKEKMSPVEVQREIGKLGIEVGDTMISRHGAQLKILGFGFDKRVAGGGYYQYERLGTDGKKVIRNMDFETLLKTSGNIARIEKSPVAEKAEAPPPAEKPPAEEKAKEKVTEAEKAAALAKTALEIDKARKAIEEVYKTKGPEGEEAEEMRKREREDLARRVREGQQEIMKMGLGEGDVIVSKSGIRRKVLEINLRPDLPGGGYMKVERTEPGKPPEYQPLTFEDILKGRGTWIAGMEKGKETRR